MNNMINIAEILKDCPKGTKLYSPLFGDVTLKEVNPVLNFPIVVTSSKGNDAAFSKAGLYFDYKEAECLLFPSSEMRDWTKFFKKGDILVNSDIIVLFEEWADSSYKCFKTSFIVWNGIENKICTKEITYNVMYFQRASKAQQEYFIKRIEAFYNGKYNPITLQVEPVKTEYSFKPFDKVLVRNCVIDAWLPGFFYKLSRDYNHPYHIMNLHHLTDYAYKQCIPYEGNEHLLGTSNPYIEKDNE